MQTAASTKPAGRVVDPQQVPALDVLGPTIQYLTPPEGADGWPCVMQGTIPPGVIVPMHSHPDPETFVMRSGRLEGLVPSPDGVDWIAIGAGEIFDVPSNAKHAWRNPGPEPAVTIIVSTVKIARFFSEIGTPVGPGGTTAWPPSEQAIEGFLETADRYGYWNATADENAAVGLELG